MNDWMNGEKVTLALILHVLNDIIIINNLIIFRLLNFCARLHYQENETFFSNNVFCSILNKQAYFRIQGLSVSASFCDFLS